MNIETVKISGEGYLINGSMSVPNALGNRHYQDVQNWIAEGNIPDPEFTEIELNGQAEQERLYSINVEMKSRIIALFPGSTHANYLEKQMNAMMRGIRINNIAKGSQTTAQKAEASALVDIADQVDTIREVGQAAEEGGTLLEDILWPA